MPVYDYECPDGHIFEIRCSLEKRQEFVDCPECQKKAKQIILAVPALLTTIIPSYPGCKKAKAGYQHSHGDIGSTKIQSGPGGMARPTDEATIALGNKLTGRS